MAAKVDPNAQVTAQQEGQYAEEPDCPSEITEACNVLTDLQLDGSDRSPVLVSRNSHFLKKEADHRPEELSSRQTLFFFKGVEQN